MLITDSHCHAGLDWFEPIESLMFQMDRHGVRRAVLIQHTRGFDNTYLVECVGRFPDRIAAVGNVDCRLPDAAHTLESWVEKGIQGFRLSLAHLADSGDYLPVLKAAQRLGISVSCYGGREHFAVGEIHRIVRDLPGLPFVVEHLAYPDINEPAPYESFRGALRLAEFDNVYMKIGGFGEYIARPEPMRHPPFDLQAIPPFIEMAMEAFGPGRLMIGTDSPPCSHREGYTNVLRYLGEYLARFTLDQQRLVYDGTASSLFTFAEDAL